MLSSNIKNKTHKDFLVLLLLVGSFPVKIVFLVFDFPFYLPVQENQKLQKYFSVFLWISFLFIRVVPRRRPRWKCWVALIWIIVELIKSPFYLVFSCWIKCFADSSLVHGTLALLLFSHRSVVQVKGNNDDFRWTGRGREKRVWTRLVQSM